MKTNLLKTLSSHAGVLKAAVLAIGVMMCGSAWAENEDFLSKATKIEWNNSEVTSSYTGGVLTVTPSSTTSDMALAITGSQSISNGQTLLVLETSSNIDTSKDMKVRNVTVGGYTFDYASSKTNSSIKEITVGSETHKLIIFSPIQDVRKATVSGTSTSVFDYYADNATMTLTKFGFNFKTTDTNDFKVYRAGFYTVAQILALYSAANPMRWVVDNASVRFEMAGTANQITASGNANKDYSAKRAAVLYKTLGALPSSITNVNYRYINVNSSSPVTEDVFAGNNATKILCHSTVATYFPTMNTNVSILASTYYPVKDGSLSNNYIKDNTTNYYASYTRNFNAGYSTCILPFAVTCDALTTAGLTAYIYSSYSDSKITCAKVTSGSIAANTPFVVKAENTGLYVIASTLSGALDGKTAVANFTEQYVTPENSKFVGSYKSEAPCATGKSYNGHVCGAFSENGTTLSYMTNTTATNYFRAFIDYGTDGSTVPMGADEVTESSTDYLYISKGYAKIGTTYYSTLAGAITAASTNETITLTGDQAITSQLSVAKTITIDGSGKTLTYTNSTDNTASCFSITGVTSGDGYKLTLTNVKFSSSNTGTYDVTLGQKAQIVLGDANNNFPKGVYLNKEARVNVNDQTLSSSSPLKLYFASDYTNPHVCLQKTKNVTPACFTTEDAWRLYKSKVSGGNEISAMKKEYTRTATVGAYGTICLPYDAKVENAVLLKMNGTIKSEGTVTGIQFDQVAANGEGNVIATAGTPYLYRATTTEPKFTMTGTAYSEPSTTGNNGFLGTYIKIEPLVAGNYFLSTSDYLFHKVINASGEGRAYVNLGIFKCYISDLSAVPEASSPAKSAITFGIKGDETTGINTVNFNEVKSVTDDKFIKNGKLVIMKNGKMYNAAGQLIK